MLLKDFQDNPKLLALLLEHHEQLDHLYDHCEKASNWDHENNEGKAHRAGALLQIELAYPDSNWAYLEWGNDDEELENVASIPEGHGVLRIHYNGEFTDWWL